LDAASRVDHGPQERLAAHYLGITGGVGGRRHALDEPEDVLPPPNAIELAHTPQLVRERELVYGLTARI
jgi:hypothetical protein